MPKGEVLFESWPRYKCWRQNAWSKDAVWLLLSGCVVESDASLDKGKGELFALLYFCCPVARATVKPGAQVIGKDSSAGGKEGR